MQRPLPGSCLLDIQIQIGVHAAPSPLFLPPGYTDTDNEAKIRNTISPLFLPPGYTDTDSEEIDIEIE